MLILLTALALAQEPVRIDAGGVRPSIDAASTTWIDDAGHIESFRFTTRGGFTLSSGSLVFEATDGERTSLLGPTLQLDLAAGYRVGRVRFGAQLPIVLAAQGDLASGFGFGEALLDVKATLLDSDASDIGVGMGASVLLPTATGTNPLGHNNLGWALRAMASYDLGRVEVLGQIAFQHRRPVELGALTWGNQFQVRVGAVALVTGPVRGSVELLAAATPGSGGAGGNPVELHLGALTEVDDDIDLRATVGFGLSRGIGTPAVRLALLATWSLGAETIDDDGDGITTADRCPTAREDFDGFQDTDGCPDPDNDGDGVLDADDQCRDDREDVDGNLDQDGCPEPPVVVTVTVADPAGVVLTGATVVVQGHAPVLAGTKARFGLEPGRYDLSVEAEGFRPLRQRLEVPEGTEHAVPIVLAPVGAHGVLRVSVTNEQGQRVQGARWHLDGAEAQPALGGMIASLVPPGEHQLVVEADGYVSSKQPVRIGDGEEINLVVSLTSN